MIRILLVWCALMVNFVAFADDAEEKEEFFPCEKTYIEATQLGFSNEGIFINQDGEWMETDAIHKDAYGLYFGTFKKKQNFWDKFWNPETHWVCKKCGAINPWQLSHCKNLRCVTQGTPAKVRRREREREKREREEFNNKKNAPK